MQFFVIYPFEGTSNSHNSPLHVRTVTRILVWLVLLFRTWPTPRLKLHKLEWPYFYIFWILIYCQICKIILLECDYAKSKLQMYCVKTLNHFRFYSNATFGLRAERRRSHRRRLCCVETDLEGGMYVYATRT